MLPALSHAEPADLQSALEAIRVKHHLPALGAAYFTTDGLIEQAVTGVRKAGTDIPATTEDLWHLGSDTKAMTATALATYVRDRKLSWDSRIISFFLEDAALAPDRVKDITLSQILSHRAGMIEDLDWRAIATGGGSLTRQRLAAVRMALKSPKYPAGDFHYSNTDYVIAGAILEKLSGEPWEKVMMDRVFTPLHMNSAGFGGTGTPGQVDEPWPHFKTGQPAPANGPDTDNPEVMGPAGTVHCTIADWVRFLTDQLRGGAGLPAMLPAAMYGAMQSPHPPDGDYGYGWLIADRDWAGGKALNHAGSNTMNFADCWLAPNRKFGVLAVTNEGGDTEAFPACDEAVGWLIEHPPAPR
ncbi:MAG TPA: serine hydrolase domain-containing protein [Chthoniobacteraceae bacterium]|nr:serine hydrolase domain-containing protein [Chthoniobacteraceae bacterium]